MERLRKLRQLSFMELERFPKMSDEEIVTISGKKHKIIIWHDEVSPEEHRIVVAMYRPVLLAGYYVEADGFVVDTRGNKRNLTPDEISPFR